MEVEKMVDDNDSKKEVNDADYYQGPDVDSDEEEEDKKLPPQRDTHWQDNNTDARSHDSSSDASTISCYKTGRNDLGTEDGIVIPGMEIIPMTFDAGPDGTTNNNDDEDDDGESFSDSEDDESNRKLRPNEIAKFKEIVGKKRRLGEVFNDGLPKKVRLDSTYRHIMVDAVAQGRCVLCLLQKKTSWPKYKCKTCGVYLCRKTKTGSRLSCEEKWHANQDLKNKRVN
jgi:hypothetical protein